MTTTISAPPRWRPIPGYPGYSITSLGRIRNNVSKEELYPWPQSKGYMVVTLRRDNVPFTELIARLLVSTFLVRRPLLDSEIVFRGPRGPKKGDVKGVTLVLFDRETGKTRLFKPSKEGS